MTRRPNKHLREPRPLLMTGLQRISRSEGQWEFHRIPAGHSQKTYVCPHCYQAIGAGDPHVVAWPMAVPLGSTTAADQRRHWHSACWARTR